MEFLKKNKENIFAFLGFALFWFGLSFITNAVTSGFHLTDDAHLYMISADLKRLGLIDTLQKWVFGEFSERLRPMHLTYKVFRTYIYGTNYYIWAINSLILATITSFACYKAVRNIGFSIINSLLFVIFSLVGLQSIIWFHLGYDEMQGVFLMSLAFWCMTLSMKSDSKKLYGILFVIFTLLFSYTKETFILMIPAFVLLKNYFYKTNNSKDWTSTFKENLFSNVFLLSVFLIDLAVIKFFLGTDKGYAGITGVNFSSYIKSISYLFNHSSGINFILITASILLLIQTNIKKSWAMVFKFFKENYLIIAVYILITVPQCIIYAKSGFFVRYIQPAIWGYSLLIVYLIDFFNKNTKHIAKRIILYTSLLILFFNLFIVNYKGILTYSNNGHHLHQALNYIANKTSDSKDIIVIGDSAYNYEQVKNVGFFLDKIYHKTNVRFYPLHTKPIKMYNERFQGLIKQFSEQEKIIKPDMVLDKSHNYIVFLNVEKLFLFDSNGWFDKNNYSRHVFGQYMVYTVKSKKQKNF